MGEDLSNDGRMFDGGDDLQGAAAIQGHCSISVANTRMLPGESLMRAGAGGGDASSCSAEVSWVLSGAFGVTSGHSLALGASTPWKQIRCNRRW
jgi:hypothetical protein